MDRPPLPLSATARGAGEGDREADRERAAAGDLDLFERGLADLKKWWHQLAIFMQNLPDVILVLLTPRCPSR